jgi:actin-like ATPase involved in cell morphogenesis
MESTMWYGVGIDLGTSFTAAAVSGPDGTRMVSMSPDVIVPSMAYPAPDGSLLTGTAALAAAADPARVARNFKRRLGDPTPLVLGGSPYSPAALMAAQLRDTVAHVTEAEGGPPASIVLTCPAIWGPYRREHFTEALRLANVANCHLVTEPEAAATHYSEERRLGDGEVVAVYDLGGGTFDTTILRMRSGEMEILGTPEGIEHMGGIDFDDTLLAHLDERLDGAITKLDPADPQAAGALANIRAMCVRAKEALSMEPDVRLAVPLPAGPREVTVTRLEFNDMIRPSVQLTVDALRRTVTSAGLRGDDLSAVLLAGGSSRIPLVSQLVSEEFGKPVRVTLHPKFTVALGAAVIAARPDLDTSANSAPAVPMPDQPPPSATAATVKPPTPSSFPRKKWLVPAIATALVVIVGAVTTMLLTADNGHTQQAGSPTGTGTKAPPRNPLHLYDSAAVAPYVGFVGNPADRSGTEILENGAKQGPVIATPKGTLGLRVVWAGGAPGQVYLRTPDSAKNLSSYVDSDGALVFDAVVHRPPAAGTSVQVHCGYPCRAEVPTTALFRNLPRGQRTTVKIPLSCFTRDGLDPMKVDTPFLVYSAGRFDATFVGVRWEEDAGQDPDATPCAELK